MQREDMAQQNETDIYLMLLLYVTKAAEPTILLLPLFFQNGTSFRVHDYRTGSGVPLGLPKHVAYTLNNIGSFKKSPSVLLPCNPWRTLVGFSRGSMVIVLKGSF